MFKRFRRLRLTQTLRNLVRETRLSLDDFIYPLFVIHGRNIKNEVASMPGVYQMSLDNILKECENLIKDGIEAIMLFGIPSTKDSIGSDSLSENGIIATSIREIKRAYPSICVIADVCLCEYTDHGHCGVLDLELQTVKNDETLKLLAKQALIMAQSGVDMIAPSSMMDGQVEAIRIMLDSNSFSHIPIMSYSTKFASSYYGPFRDVADSTPSFGDRRSYQMDFANRKEAILESIEDENQGADILMVKPALAYLDIVRDIKEQTLLPLAIYNVSGEYALLKAGQKLGLIDYDKMILENMIAFKRAGADLIISYHTKEIANILNN